MVQNSIHDGGSCFCSRLISRHPPRPWEGDAYVFIHSFIPLILTMPQMALSSGQGSQERAEETQKPSSPGADIPSPVTTHTASHLHIVLPAELSHLPLLSVCPSPTHNTNHSGSQLCRKLVTALPDCSLRAPHTWLRAHPAGMEISFICLDPSLEYKGACAVCTDASPEPRHRTCTGRAS